MWSGPVLAGALVTSAGLLVVLSMQVEVTPPPPPEKLVEHRTCSQMDIATLRERIARMQRAMFTERFEEKERRDGSDVELDRWRREEIVKARGALLGCGPVGGTDVDLCEGFNLTDAQRELSFRHEVRAEFGQRLWYREVPLRALEMLTGMCSVTGARTWPSPPDPWLEREREEYRSHVRDRS